MDTADVHKPVKDTKPRKVASETQNVSDRNIPIEIDSSRRLSADDIGQDEAEERILMLRKLLGEDTSIRSKLKFLLISCVFTLPIKYLKNNRPQSIIVFK